MLQLGSNVVAATKWLHKIDISVMEVKINGIASLVRPEDGNITLLDYMRGQAHTMSTKASCSEGGCGACAVMVDGRSVNSCLMPVYAVEGCEVTTAEGLDGGIAERLAGFHASQCGFCTPGMAVACHAALSKAAANGKVPTAMELRNALDGNLCRCTGYRPIIDACTSFADGVDIEDFGLNMFTSAKQPLPTADTKVCCGSHAVALGGGQLKVVQLGPNQKLHVPKTVPQLVEVLSQLAGSGGSVRIVAGNTGHGVFKDWPFEDNLVHITKVPELREVSVQPGSNGSQVVRVGAGVTLSALIDQLDTWSKSPTTKQSTTPESASSVWNELSAHLCRIAGSHVRNSGTVVGNLVLTRKNGLPSDVATLLLATGAQVEVYDTAVKVGPKTLALFDYLRPSAAIDTHKDAGLLVTAVSFPLPQAGSRFWSSRIASRWSNSAAIINAAIMLPGDRSVAPRVVIGLDLEAAPNKHNWKVSNCPSVEAAVLSNSNGGKVDLAALLTAALTALPADLETGLGANGVCDSARVQYLKSAAEGFVVQALSKLYGADNSDPVSILDPSLLSSHDLSSGSEDHPSSDSNGNSEVVSTGIDSGTHSPGTASLLPAKLSAPKVVKARQDIPDTDPEVAPLTTPVPKESALLQAKGLAVYSDDVPVARGALFAAWVTSTVVKGIITSIDTTEALAIPGVVRFVGYDDIPVPDPGPADEPVFTKDVQYHGQGIGLILATSYMTASRAAKLVKVQYAQPETPAVLSFEDAIAAKSLYPLEMMLAGFGLPVTPEHLVVAGTPDASDKVEAAPHKQHIKLHLPSQHHFYMEPQTAVAELDEGGQLKVYVSTQSQEHVLAYVARALGLKHHALEVTNKRLGGAFGGKCVFPSLVAAAAAVASKVTGRQVRLATNRNADMAMVGGRCDAQVDVGVGFDDEGHILAADLKMAFAGGAYPSNSVFDIICALRMADSTYNIPAFHLEYSMVKLNIPPRNSVRAPGDMMSVIAIEAVVDAVATQLGLDPSVVRKRNLWPVKGDSVFNSFGQSHGGAEQYSLPRIWKELKASSDYDARLAHIKEFNASNVWRKRAITMQPSMYPIMAVKKTAVVHIYVDGSVRVAVPGAEVGQGLYIKALQTAAYELSKILPAAQRPLPLDLFKPQEHSSYILPHQGLTGGSTASDAAVASVSAACQELVQNLKPLAAQLGDKLTWNSLIASAFPMPTFPPAVQLTVASSGSYGDQLIGNACSPFHSYTTYGAAVTEVEIDVLTGDRRVLAVDVLFDCGKCINPGVDIGQIEGAFMMGLGQVLSEYMAHDPDTGASLTNSTWSYKPPGPLCVPERFNISILRNSPLAHKGALSAKGIGEPAILLATSVLSAVRIAVRAAAADVFGVSSPDQHIALEVPATPQSIKLAIGTQSLLKLLPKLLPASA